MSVSICHTFHPEHSRIADWLLLNGTLTSCPGLLHGKLGIAIFFFHYARFTGEELFDEYAWDLMAAMQEQLHANYRPDYERGIAGIGVGIDYLIRSGLIEVDEDFFEDLDERMYRAVMYDPYPDYSRNEGLTGYGWYWLCRRGPRIACRGSPPGSSKIRPVCLPERYGMPIVFCTLMPGIRIRLTPWWRRIGSDWWAQAWRVDMRGPAWSR